MNSFFTTLKLSLLRLITVDTDNEVSREEKNAFFNDAFFSEKSAKTKHPVCGHTPKSEKRGFSLSKSEIHFPASLEGLRNELKILHQKNFLLEQDVERLEREKEEIREKALRLGNALFESALLN
jgi:hypothetical protein